MSKGDLRSLNWHPELMTLPCDHAAPVMEGPGDNDDVDAEHEVASEASDFKDSWHCMRVHVSTWMLMLSPCSILRGRGR
eukprot:6463310-Amphidinium_carterae.2